MKFILTRHGETVKNAQGLVYGTLPSKLTTKGLQQVKAMAEILKVSDFDEIFCSDLDRCAETAEPIIAKHHVPITYTILLREQEQGSLVGKSVKDVDWNNLPLDVETPDQMAERAKQFLSLFVLSQPRAILIVSHRRFLNTFVNVLLGVAPNFEDGAQLMQNSSLTVIECSKLGSGRVLQANDVFHLSTKA